GGAGHLARLEIVGDEDRTLQAEPCRVRGDASGEVTRRCAGEDLETQLDGARGRYRHDAILVGTGRMVDRIVLDVEFANAEAPGQPVGLDQRRPSRVQARARFALDRQQRPVAPDTPGAGGEVLAREARLDRVVVEVHFEWAHAL